MEREAPSIPRLRLPLTMAASHEERLARAEKRRGRHKLMFVLLHLAAVPAFFVRPDLTDGILFLVCYTINGVGISLGYHRLLSHRSFDCPRWVRRTLAVMGATALEGGPIAWVGIHRRHHEVPDHAGVDPHSPKDGFWHAHMGWIFENFEEVGLENYRRAPDLEEDPFIHRLNEEPYAHVPWLVLALLCTAVGGLSALLWAVLFRTVFAWHITWCINSVCHVLGSKPHPISDTSGNVWWMALPTFGEAWHNNHHAFPRYAYFGHHWWQVDPAGYVLWCLERTGLAWNVIRP